MLTFKVNLRGRQQQQQLQIPNSCMQVLLVISLECLNIIFLFWWNPAGGRGGESVSLGGGMTELPQQRTSWGTLPKWLYFSQGLKTRQLCLEQPIVSHWHPFPPSPSFRALNLDGTAERRASHVCLGQKVRRETWEPSAVWGGGSVGFADIHICFRAGGTVLTAFQWS